MENIKKKLLNFSKTNLFSLAVVLICVFPLFKFEYSTDTYHFALHESVGGVCGAMWLNGRLVIHDFTKIFRTLGIGMTPYYYFSFILAIICASLAITTIYGMLKGHINKKLAYFLSIITILNPMVFELFLFVEKGFFLFAVYMAVLSAKFFLMFLQGKRLYLIFSYLCLIICCFTYQPMPGVFVALALVFIVAYSKKFKDFLINTGVAISVYAVPTLCNFIVMRIYNMSERLSGGLNFANIYKFLTFGLYNPVFLLVYFLVFSVLFFVVFFSSKKKTGKAFTKDSALVFFKYSFLIAGTILATAAPSIATTPENVWFTLRYSYPIGTLVATIPMLFNFKSENIVEESNENIKTNISVSSKIMIAVLLTFLILFHLFFVGRHVTNYKDETDAMKIGEIINDYETKTGNKIKYIALYRDKNSKNSFDGVVSLPNCNVRAITTKWCNIPHLNLFLDREFEEKNACEKYLEYFSSTDWSEINSEMFIFEEDTLHLGIY